MFLVTIKSPAPIPLGRASFCIASTAHEFSGFAASVMFADQVARPPDVVLAILGTLSLTSLFCARVTAANLKLPCGQV